MISAIGGINYLTYRNNQVSRNLDERGCVPMRAHVCPQVSMPKLSAKDVIYFTPNFGRAQEIHPKKYDLKDKTILITGGTGTLGGSLIKTLLTDYSPKKVIVYSRDEMKQHEMKRHNRKVGKLSYVIGDVRDKTALEKALRGVDVVIHTAAMKHVSICEENPTEAIKTNIAGSQNIIDAVLNSDVKRVLLISTDKASAPSCLYGATKFVAEKLFLDANKLAEEAPRFSCIRLGNIAGSRGSIVPLFKEQAKSGTIKITDKDMTRFFMSPKQAAEAVLSSIEIMNGEEVFVPKVKNTSILELAKQIAPEAEIEYIGAGAGEKLSEDFITPIEGKHSLDLLDRYVILTPKGFENRAELWENFKTLKADFDYSSANKEFKMTSSDLQTLLEA